MRRQFVEEGHEAALVSRPSPRAYAQKPDGAGEARLVKPACSTPPEGRKRRTLQSLADRTVAPGHAEEGLSYERDRAPRP